MRTVIAPLQEGRTIGASSDSPESEVGASVGGLGRGGIG